MELSKPDVSRPLLLHAILLVATPGMWLTCVAIAALLSAYGLEASKADVAQAMKSNRGFEEMDACGLHKHQYSNTKIWMVDENTECRVTKDYKKNMHLDGDPKWATSCVEGSIANQLKDSVLKAEWGPSTIGRARPANSEDPLSPAPAETKEGDGDDVAMGVRGTYGREAQATASNHGPDATVGLEGMLVHLRKAHSYYWTIPPTNSVHHSQEIKVEYLGYGMRPAKTVTFTIVNGRWVSHCVVLGYFDVQLPPPSKGCLPLDWATNVLSWARAARLCSGVQTSEDAAFESRTVSRSSWCPVGSPVSIGATSHVVVNMSGFDLIGSNELSSSSASSSSSSEDSMRRDLRVKCADCVHIVDEHVETLQYLM